MVQEVTKHLRNTCSGNPVQPTNNLHENRFYSMTQTVTLGLTSPVMEDMYWKITIIDIGHMKNFLVCLSG